MEKLDELKSQIIAQGPTAEQRDAIFTDELEYLLRASPGSGKTWTSCRRFVWRGANWPYPAGGLALLSFTNGAISEFRRATGDLGRRDLLSDPNYVGTFDAFIERFILTPFGHLLTNTGSRPRLIVAPRPSDRGNQKLKSWIEVGGKKQPVDAWTIDPVLVETAKGSRVRFQSKYKKEVDSAAVKELIQMGFYTHSQRVYWALRLLLDRPHISRVLARRFPEIIVDEAQDTNPWFVVTLNVLREASSRITLVGDPDQCIFEFSMTQPTSLPSLKEKWGIKERPLRKSFRCNNAIASVVKVVGGNDELIGCGEPLNEKCRAFIVRDDTVSYSTSVLKFESLLDDAGQTRNGSAVVCRAHKQLEAIRGAANYADLQGVTKQLALASFHRDVRRDYRKAYELVEKSLRAVVGEATVWTAIDENPESATAMTSKLAIWRFVKFGLPSVELRGDDWINRSRKQVGGLLAELDVGELPKLNNKIRKNGLKKEATQLPLFAEESLFPSIRQDTIHKVKGESIDAVLVIAGVKFWNSVVKATIENKNIEDRRLAYVAMTRARHLLMIGLPAKHFDKYAETWTNWGFDIA